MGNINQKKIIGVSSVLSIVFFTYFFLKKDMDSFIIRLENISKSISQNGAVNQTDVINRTNQLAEVLPALVERKKNYRVNPKIRENCINCESIDLKEIRAEVAKFITHYVFGGRFYPTKAYQCKKCNMIFTEISYTDDQMDVLYFDYRGSDYVNVRDFFEPGYRTLNVILSHNPEDHKGRINNIVGLLKLLNIDSASFKSTIDYGGDRGQNIPTSFPGDKFVYDVSDVPVECGIKKIKDIGLIKEKKFDFIMCMHVLEHLSEPIKVLNQLKNMMHEKSYLYIELPYEPAVEETNLSNPDFKITAHEHINFYTPESIRSGLQNIGLKVMYSEYREVDVGHAKVKVISAIASK